MYLKRDKNLVEHELAFEILLIGDMNRICSDPHGPSTEDSAEGCSVHHPCEMATPPRLPQRNGAITRWQMGYSVEAVKLVGYCRIIKNLSKYFQIYIAFVNV